MANLLHTPKKKVLYVITKGNFGGAQRYVYDLATHIPKREFEPVVVFGEGGVLGEKLDEAGIRTIHIKSLKRNIGFFSDIAAFFAIWSVIRKERPDVLHLNSSKAGILGTIAGRLSGTTHIIFTTHGWAFNEERSWFMKLVLLKIYWWIIILSHKTIAVSKRTADQISHLPFLKKKITVIYNGIEMFPLASQSEARAILAPGAVERIWIGTIAELHPSKGLDYLIQAFAPLPKKYANVALVIVGSGEERKSLVARVDKLGMHDKVIFAGFKKDARTYLSAFDIFTLTSRTEAFPYAPLEAGMAHLPVVASWAGGIPEIIEHTVSGMLVDPTQTEQLTNTLDDLIAQKDLRIRLGEALYKKVSQEFTLTKMIQETLKLY